MNNSNGRPPSKVGILALLLIAAATFCYRGFMRGYRYGDVNVVTVSALALWATWWGVAALTKEPQFVRKTLAYSLLLVLPATLNSMCRASGASDFFFALAVAVAALLSAGGYAITFPKPRSR
jgi:hypothetical protein